jgi:hypothetical protein
MLIYSAIVVLATNHRIVGERTKNNRSNEMKNRHRFTILTSLVAAVFILSLFSGIAAAQKPNENNGNQKQFTSTEKQFQNAKAQLDKALKQFIGKKDSKSKDQLVLTTRDIDRKSVV